jgi:Fe-S cluster assembly iron-binding protein IscA
MSKLFIDNRAIEFIKKALENEKSDAIRVFTGGGGCCKRFEIIPVRKPLSGDVIFRQRGFTVYMEKELVENVSAINIRFEGQGLIIDFK